MATNYKILGQGVNSLKVDAPTNGSTIISELKIKNTSYPTNVDVMCSSNITVPFEKSYPLSTNDKINASAVQSDGKIVIGGEFTTVNGVARSRIARLNRDGSLDNLFNPDIGFPGYRVHSIVIQPDGNILLGGDFGLIRLQSTGLVESTFEPMVNGAVFDIALQPDGKIVIGGAFTNVNNPLDSSYDRLHIARLNSDGSLDLPFFAFTNDDVKAVALQQDGKILIGGFFTNARGQTRNYIARLNSDGSLDTSFDPNASSFVQDIAIQPDGKIIIGGFFAIVGGQPSPKVARLNPDGTLDAAAVDGGGLNQEAYAVAVDEFGRIYVGGRILDSGGTLGNRISRLNPDFTRDTSFDVSISISFGKEVRDITFLPNKKVLIVGIFDTVNDEIAQNSLLISQNFASESKDYIIKNKTLSYDEEVKISGGIVLESGQSLVIETDQYNPDNVIIQAYGIEETA